MKQSKTAFSSFMLFFIGTFSVTQIRVIGSIGISELFMYLAAPTFFMMDLRKLRHNGFMPFLRFGLAVNIMCIVSGLYNHTHPLTLLKGVAITYSLLAIPICLHHYLNENLNGLRWLLMGLSLTFVINIFVFQSATETTMLAGGETGEKAIEGIVSGPIFWIGRLKHFVMLPITGWYLTIPVLYSVLMPFMFAGFSMLTSVSGRSSALGAIGSAAIVFIGGKTRSGMHRLSKNFYSLLVIAILSIFVLNTAYRFVVRQGWLGDAALAKYEHQTRKGAGVLSLLMSGRMESFLPLYAGLHKPFIGHGPHALDVYGYTEEYLDKFGAPEDYDEHMAFMRHYQRMGILPISRIPAHSHITGFFLWFGIIGGAYWLYCLYLLGRYFKSDITAIPQWFGYLAAGAPMMLWNLFFSGLGYRIFTTSYFTAILIAHAVSRGWLQLPFEMQKEIWEKERK